MTAHSPLSSSTATRPAPRWRIGAFILMMTTMLGSGAYFFWPAPKDLPDQLQPQTPAGPALFRDATPDSGIDFTYKNGEEADLLTMLEFVGGGVAMRGVDYDGDGLLDLFFTGGGSLQDKQIKGHPCKLYKNLGNWKFRDVTAEAGLDQISFYTHGVAVADYDCDGWPDLLITGYGHIALFHNESRNGKRRFVNVTKAAGLDDDLWSTSAGFADLTGSGFPDLYVCHYVNWSFANNPPCKEKNGTRRDICSPLVFESQPHTLFFNQGNQTFRRAAADVLRKNGKGLGVVLADLNGDGRPDIYVANDLDENALYLNRGNGVLEETGHRAGVARDASGYANGSMGVDVGDYDGSGRPSLFVANYQGKITPSTSTRAASASCMLRMPRASRPWGKPTSASARPSWMSTTTAGKTSSSPMAMCSTTRAVRR